METDQIPNISVVVDLIAIVVAAFFFGSFAWPKMTYFVICTTMVSRLMKRWLLQVKKNEERHRSLNELILLKIKIRERKKIRKKERKKRTNKKHIFLMWLFCYPSVEWKCFRLFRLSYNYSRWQSAALQTRTFWSHMTRRFKLLV